MTPRTAPWPSLGADVARVLAGARPAYVSERTAAAFATALESLRDDVWAVLTRHAIAARGTPGADRGQTSAAAELGVGRASVHRWVRGGWLLGARRVAGVSARRMLRGGPRGRREAGAGVGRE